MILYVRKKVFYPLKKKKSDWMFNQPMCFGNRPGPIPIAVLMLFSSVTSQKNPLNSFLHKGLDAYNISDVLCLEKPATSGSPALLIDFIFTKAVYLKLRALARIAAENKGFPNPSGLFTLFKVDCCSVRDVLTVLLFSCLHYFNRLFMLRHPSMYSILKPQREQQAETPCSSKNSKLFLLATE